MTTISGIVMDSTGAPAAGRVVRAYRRDTGALLGAAMTSDGVAAPYNPYWAKTSSLLHFDGANASTTFTDETGRTWVAGGNAKISTAQSVFGGGAAYFDGTGDSIQTDNSSDFDFGNGPFTVACFVRYTGSLPPGGNYKFIVGRDNVGGTRGWVLLVDGDYSGKVGFFGFVGGTSYGITTLSAITPDVWTHIAVSREDDTLRLFRDGVLQGSVSLPAGATLNNSAVGALIGCGRQSGNPVSNWSWSGWIDELCIIKGEAQWTSDFTPPAGPYLSSAYTPPIPLGEYTIDTGSYAGEVNVICLDDDAGTLENDLIHRAFPV